MCPLLRLDRLVLTRQLHHRYSVSLGTKKGKEGEIWGKEEKADEQDPNARATGNSAGANT